MKSAEPEKPHELESVQTENRTSNDQFPTEPFSCPACGQLLAPSCRVCVACKHKIDAAEIRRPGILPAVVQPAPRELEPVRFSWRIFLIVFAISIAGVWGLQRVMSPQKGQLVLGGVQILCSLWVLFDAMEKRLPKPLRWGIGTLLVWIVIFPWYLERRTRPKQPCPFVEAKVSPRLLVVLLILMAVLICVMLKYAPPH